MVRLSELVATFFRGLTEKAKHEAAQELLEGVTQGKWSVQDIREMRDLLYLDDVLDSMARHQICHPRNLLETTADRVGRHHRMIKMVGAVRCGNRPELGIDPKPWVPGAVCRHNQPGKDIGLVGRTNRSFLDSGVIAVERIIQVGDESRQATELVHKAVDVLHVQEVSPLDIEEETFKVITHDIFTQRNEAVFAMLEKALPHYDTLIVPWGALHMTEIEKEAQELGFFQLGEKERLSVDFGEAMKHLKQVKRDRL